MRKKIINLCFVIYLILLTGCDIEAGDDITLDTTSPGDDITLDTTPPGEVSGILIEERDESVIISWVDPEDNDFDKVEIWYGTEDIINTLYLDLPAATGTEIGRLTNFSEYAFRLHTIDSTGNRSEGVISHATPHPLSPTDNIAPSEVSELTIEPQDGMVTLSWSNPTDEDFSEVRIYYGLDENLLNRYQGEINNLKTEILNLENYSLYTFKVVTVDTVGNSSEGLSKNSMPYDPTPSAVIYVNGISGSDLYPGTPDFPKATITSALDIAVKEVHVAAGEYIVNETTYIEMKPGIKIRGGFAQGNWFDRKYIKSSDRNNNRYMTKITYVSDFIGTGDNPASAVRASDSGVDLDSVLEGFIINSSSNPDTGCGIFLSGMASPLIQYNTIIATKIGVYGSYINHVRLKSNEILINATEYYPIAIKMWMDSDVELEHNRIVVNSSYSRLQGIECYNDSDGYIRNNTILLNYTGRSFGALNMEGIQQYIFCDTKIENNTIVYSCSNDDSITEPIDAFILGVKLFSTDYIDEPFIHNNIFDITFPVSPGVLLNETATAIQANAGLTNPVKNNVFKGFTNYYYGDVLGLYPDFESVQSLDYFEGNIAISYDQDILIDGPGGDMRFKESTPEAIKEGGLDLSLDFTNDYKEQERTVPWSIGAFEDDYIDMPSFEAIYVHPQGSDENIGSEEFPKRTIKAGISTAKGWGIPEVRVAAGDYIMSDVSGLIIEDGLRVKGGYSAMDWNDRQYLSINDRQNPIYRTQIFYSEDWDTVKSNGSKPLGLVVFNDTDIDNETILEGFTLLYNPELLENQYDTIIRSVVVMDNGAAPTLRHNTIKQIAEYLATKPLSCYGIYQGQVGSVEPQILNNYISVRASKDGGSGNLIAKGIQSYDSYISNNLIVVEGYDLLFVSAYRTVAGIDYFSGVAVNNTIYINSIDRVMGTTYGIGGDGFIAYNNILFSGDGYDEYGFFDISGSDSPDFVNNYSQGFDDSITGGIGNITALEEEILFVNINDVDYIINGEEDFNLHNNSIVFLKSGAETVTYMVSDDLDGNNRGSSYSLGALEY